MKENKELQTELYKVKKKSHARKRQLRSMHERIKLYINMVDAAISDAARWKAEADLWKERYERAVTNGENS